MFLSGNTLIPDLSGIPPTAIIRKAARLKETRSTNVQDLSAVFRLYDQDATDRGILASPVSNSAGSVPSPSRNPWLFNTSKTAGTAITKHRAYVRLALSGGDERFPKLHVPACSDANCGCPAPHQWYSSQV